MIIPLIRGADQKNHGELHAFILLIRYMANIIPVLGPTELVPGVSFQETV